MENKKKVLIIDDEKDMVKVLEGRLNGIGYETIVATDGQEGLEKARLEIPALILLDLMLPKMDGYKVCRMLKFDKKFKKIPIIIITARSQTADKKLGQEVGADAYITKPFKPNQLIEKIQEFIGKP